MTQKAQNGLDIAFGTGALGEWWLPVQSSLIPSSAQSVMFVPLRLLQICWILGVGSFLTGHVETLFSG